MLPAPGSFLAPPLGYFSAGTEICIFIFFIYGSGLAGGGVGVGKGKGRWLRSQCLGRGPKHWVEAIVLGGIPAVLPHPKPSRQQERTPSESISESIRAGRPR